MNEQMQHFRNIIDFAESGDEASIGLLRTICRMAADAAPANDLLRISRFLYGIRADAARTHIAKN